MISSLVFGTTRLLDELVWADPESEVVTIGREEILKGTVINNKSEIKYGDGWEEYLHDPEYPEFKEMVEPLRKKLINADTKGAGKFAGKFGGKFAGVCEK